MSDDTSVALDDLELRSEYYAGRNLRADAKVLLIAEQHRLFYYYDEPDKPEGSGGAFWYYTWASESSEGIRVDALFYGWATYLDGVRHLYFTNDGYLFYPEGDALPEALTELYKLFPQRY